MLKHGGMSTAKRGRPAAGDRGGPLAAESAEGSIGPWLRERRQKLGATVEDVSRGLRLQGLYIEALEAEAFAQLPARVYVLGYVRSMAQAYGLDPEEAAARLRAAWPDAGRQSMPAASGPARMLAERRLPVSAILSLTIVLAVAGYAYWYASRSADMGRPLLSPVAELEVTAPAEQPPPTPAPGPLQLLGVPELAQSADAAGALGRKDDGSLAQAEDRQPLPVEPLPRPRPGTEAAQLFAATYRVPKPDPISDPAQPAVADRQGIQGPGDRLPAPDSLVAYLPSVRLRSDLGPLRTGADLPAVVQYARRAPTPQPAGGDPLSIGRTQAFAAVPAGDAPLATARHKARDRTVPGGLMTALPRAADPDATPLPAITILADRECWVEIRSRSGKLVTQRLLQSGERLDVPERRGLTLTAGNAGGIRVLVNGVTAPALGGDGQVVRGVRLTQQELLARR